MTTKNFLQKIRTYIANNDINTALQQLRIVLENSSHLNEIILQNARFQEIRKQIRLGIVHFSDANLVRNKIIARLLDLLTEIEE